MRFPEAKIKEAILHPDIEIRDRAANYFSRSFSHDVSIMTQVIRAVETYGREGAYRLIGAGRDLPQTEASIDWVISELNDEQSSQYDNYTYNLTRLLVEADPALLLPKETAILDSRHFIAQMRSAFTERLRMLSWDEATGWRRLEEFCEQGKDKQYTNQVNLAHAECIVESLDRFGKACEEKVHAFLGQRVEDDHDSPISWMQPLVARLSGRVCLESAIPLLIARLREDRGDFLNETCGEALARIGTPAVLHAIAEAYPGGDDSFRIYASEPLERIRSDLAVEICLRLLNQEQDSGIQRILAETLLAQFAGEGIEAARRYLLRRELDFQDQGLRAELLETCKFMGEHFPEYDAWMAEESADKKEHWRRMKELEDDPQGMMRFLFGKLAGKEAADVPKIKPAAPAVSLLTQPRQPVKRQPRQSMKRQKTGRNDRCPCGSGKKFKVCCGRR